MRLLGVVGSSLLLLGGCQSRDDQVVDLAGIVFLVFVALLGLRFAAARITTLPALQQFWEWLRKSSVKIVGALALVGLVFIVAGSVLPGIHRVLVLVGLVLGVQAGLLLQWSVASDKERQKRFMEGISIATSFAFILLMLWFVGGDLFKGI